MNRDISVSPRDEHFIPPLRYHWLTRFYDPVVRLTTRENTFRHALVQQVALRPHDKVLDLGCGTATLTIALAKSCPSCSVTGLDADAEALAIAQKKARQAQVAINFERGHSSRLPFSDATFDRVVSSLFFHHLTRGEKLATLAEVRRVLKPGGELHVADWGKPSNALMRTLFLTVQLLDGFNTTRDSVTGALPELMRATGYRRVDETAQVATPLGTIRLFRAA